MENKFDNIRNKYNLQEKLYSEKKINTLKNITSYSSIKNENLIEELKEEITEQEDYKKLLKDKNIGENSKLLFKFINDNEEIINKQFDEIKLLSEKLKIIINENNSLQEEERVYESFINAKKTININDKIEEINIIKKNLKLFLKKNNIYLESI